jgi:hypothetical protein
LPQSGPGSEVTTKPADGNSRADNFQQLDRLSVLNAIMGRYVQCVIIGQDQYRDASEQKMEEPFQDIRIIGKPDADKVKAGSKPYTHVFSFPLSSAPPQRWKELLVQEWVYRIMQAPRHIWINHQELAIDCSVEELALIVERVGEDIQIVNRKYRKEIETDREKTEQEQQLVVEEKRADDASVKRVIDELILPG